MVEIELFGSAGAIHGESGYVVDQSNWANPKSPIPILARLLVKHGFDPLEPTRIVRNGVVIYRDEHTLSYWSAYNYVDDVKRGPCRVKFVPFDKEKFDA